MAFLIHAPMASFPKSASAALEPVLNTGARVLLVTADSDDAIGLNSYTPPVVPGQVPQRIAAGVFGYKSGATLLVWSADRHVKNLPNVSAPFHIVLDPMLGIAHAAVWNAVTFAIRWGLTHAPTGAMGMSVTAKTGIPGSKFEIAIRAKFGIELVLDKGSKHLTVPYVCGLATGRLLESKVGSWLVYRKPSTVVLRDALGRATTLDDLDPVAEVSALGKKFRLCGEVENEIRFVEVRGG